MQIKPHNLWLLTSHLNSNNSRRNWQSDTCLNNVWNKKKLKLHRERGTYSPQWFCLFHCRVQRFRSIFFFFEQTLSMTLGSQLAPSDYRPNHSQFETLLSRARLSQSLVFIERKSRWSISPIHRLDFLDLRCPEFLSIWTSLRCQNTDK